MESTIIGILSTFLTGLLGCLTLFIKLYFKSKKQKNNIEKKLDTLIYVFSIYVENNGSDKKIKELIKRKIKNLENI